MNCNLVLEWIIKLQNFKTKSQLKYRIIFHFFPSTGSLPANFQDLVGVAKMKSRLIHLYVFHDVELQTVRHCVFRGCSIIKSFPCTKAQLIGNNSLIQKYSLAAAELPNSCWLPPGCLSTTFLGGKKKKDRIQPLTFWKADTVLEYVLLGKKLDEYCKLS